MTRRAVTTSDIGYGRTTSRRLRLLRLASVAAILGLVLGVSSNAAAAGGQTPHKARIDKALQDALEKGQTGTGRMRVIVRTESGAREHLAADLRTRGVRVAREHKGINAVTALVDADAIRDLRDDSRVLGISADAIVTSDGAADDRVAKLPQNNLLETLGLAGGRYTGKGVRIGVIDSGLKLQADLGGARAARFWDFTDEGRQGAPFDDYGHGTHVASLIAGTGRGSKVRVTVTDANGKVVERDKLLYPGIAPEATVLSFKVLDGKGAGYTSAVLDAIDFIVDNNDSLRIDILNLSLGHPVYEPSESDPLVLAVERAVRAGIVVVTSAGNFGTNPATGQVGYGGITSPGNAPSAITVGAVDTGGTANRRDDSVAPYSSRGPSWYDALAKPDIVAPGHNLVAAGAVSSWLYEQYPGRRVTVKAGEGEYLRLSGTSMAAAVTSGVVALMLEANRSAHHHARLTPNAVKALLQYTAVPLAGDDHLAEGTGGLNGEAAVDLAEAVNPAAPIGTYWLPGAVVPSTLIDGDDLAWAQTVVWGNTVVWGQTALFNQPLWSLTVVWGSTVVWGNTVVWGSTVLSGNTVVWGDTVVWGNAVWDHPEVWSSTVVWGNSLLSGSLGPETVIWGNLAPLFQAGAQ